ncbi:uncharacterized protein LOC115034941 [Acyrthosiphon pisum]|uniref:SWIM-type domain-containing protein n=1 Tax=Acyrthosiphon pisum TaxID=7029 RepID=A0A8R2JX13_ACYPI|nr:uncharacterized protein LOC115034941 [Acyrthosiphon pisum]
MNHSHTLDTADALGNLRSIPDTRQLFETYFNDGLGITDSMTFHEGKLELEGDEYVIADASLNPKYRTVQHWHNVWREFNLGPRIGEGVIEKLQSKKASYEEKGVKILINEEPFAVVICTPLMQRAHKLPYSKDIVFSDSTASCDAHNHSITFMLTPCAVGAVPLAVIITKGQSMNDYKIGFELVKNCVGPDGFGGECFPKLFITDDSEAERQALQSVWPQSKQLLCRFHICQSVWRWLWGSENNIEKLDRPILYALFNKILTASSVEMAEVAYLNAIDSNNNVNVAKYPNWVNYVNLYWKRKEIWVLSYRNFETHGHQTNNFSEICVRIYKDIVLSRNKAYNVVSLVDFTSTVMEHYYIRRIRKFCNSRCDVSRLFLISLQKKIKYLTIDMIESLENNMFKVPSEKDTEMYEVNATLGYCTCYQGHLGTFCKHQAAVYFFFSKELPNAPPVTAKCRYNMAVLAFGDKVQPLSFYNSLNAQDEIEENNTEIIDVNYTNNMSKVVIDEKQPELITNNVLKPVQQDFQSVVDLMVHKNDEFGSTNESLNIFLKNLETSQPKTLGKHFCPLVGNRFLFVMLIKLKYEFNLHQ